MLTRLLPSLVTYPRAEDSPWQLRLSPVGGRPQSQARTRLSRWATDREMGSRERMSDGGISE